MTFAKYVFDEVTKFSLAVGFPKVHDAEKVRKFSCRLKFLNSKKPFDKLYI